MKQKRQTKRKADPSIYRYTVNLNEKENILFWDKIEQSGMTNISRFISMMIFEKEMKVLVIDKARIDYYMKLSHFYRQFQLIGNNYNQVVKAIKTNFGDKRAIILLHRLEKLNKELMELGDKIAGLTDEFNHG